MYLGYQIQISSVNCPAKQEVQLIKKTRISSFHVVFPVNIMTKEYVRTMNESRNCRERKLLTKGNIYITAMVFFCCFLQCIIVCNMQFKTITGVKSVFLFKLCNMYSTKGPGTWWGSSPLQRLLCFCAVSCHSMYLYIE